MKIACPSCSAKYSIADEKVQNKLAKIRCRKCGATIVIDGKADPPTIQTAGGSVHPQAAAVSHVPASVGPGVGTYTVDVAENDQRQMSVAEIVDAYNTGAISADTYVWQEGMADWAPLADVPEINDALHAAAAASQPPAMQPAAMQPAAVAASAAAAPLFGAAAAEPARAATRAAASADLFGRIDSAGSEHDVGSRDEAADAGITTATTGARNESSVLFSLSALTASDAKPETGGGGGGAKTSEDSGLIDLAALTASAERGDSAQSVDLGAAPLAAAPLVSPLGAAPLTGGTTSPLGDMGQPPPSGSKNGLFIGGGIAIAAVVAGLVFLLKEEPPPVPAVVPTATIVVTTVVPAPAPEATADEEAKDDDAKEEAEDKNAVKQTAPKKKYTAPKSSPKPSPKPASKPAEKPKSSEPAAPKPKKSKCNCPKGDLMCAMKCSTK